MRRFLIILSLLAIPCSAGAQQAREHLLSVRDVIELTKAGIGEEALVALIEVNRRVFPVDVDTLKTLKDAGVAPSVIVAMIKSGRTAPATAPPLTPMDLTAAPVPQALPAQAATPVVVVEHHHEQPVVREVPVAVPVFVTVPVRRIDRHHAPRPPKHIEPVYWGWGGKLRPDAWQPAIEVQKDAKIPRHPQRK